MRIKKDVKRDLDVFFFKEEIRQIIISEKKKMLMNECGQRRKCILKLAPTINQSKSKSISEFTDGQFYVHEDI